MNKETKESIIDYIYMSKIMRMAEKKFHSPKINGYIGHMLGKKCKNQLILMRCGIEIKNGISRNGYIHEEY